MAIYRMVGDKEDLAQVPVTSFGQTGVLERQDLQRILRDKPEILEDGLFILTEEFSNWQGSGRSIDLLGIDATGRLVVVELKRGETGEHMDLQAIRYAAMVSTLTLRQAIEAHQIYLNKRGVAEDAEERVNSHLENLDDTQEFSTDYPRILLVSEGFSSELTTCVLWLNRNGLDIACIRMQPYRNSGELLVETSQVIPLPETADYLVRIRDRESEVQTVQRQRYGPRQEVPGGDAFRENIARAPAQFQSDLLRLYEWAVSLEKEGLAQLESSEGKSANLGVKPIGKNVLVSIRNSPNKADVLFYGDRFRSMSPKSIPLLDGLKRGISLRDVRTSSPLNIGGVSDELLSALTAAYREANGLLAENGDEGGDGE